MSKIITITLTEQDQAHYSDRVLAKGISAWIQIELEKQRDKIELERGAGSAFDFCVVHD